MTGRKLTLWSDVLSEVRTVLIAVPESYSDGVLSYPVLFVLDGRDEFPRTVTTVRQLASSGNCPEMIIAGIVNTDRARDLAPPLKSSQDSGAARYYRNKAGGIDPFLRFMEAELIPLLNERFRTQNFRILLGSSLGGLTGAYALVKRPELFQAVVASDPPLGWSDGTFLESLKRDLAGLPGRHWFQFSWSEFADADFIARPSAALADFLKSHPPQNIQWGAQFYAGARHGGADSADRDGLKRLFEGFSDAHTQGLIQRPDAEAAVRNYYAQLSEHYGFDVALPDRVANTLAYELWQEGAKERALAVYEQNLRVYPGSIDTSQSLGQLFMEMGRFPEALAAYQKALHLRAERGYTDDYLAEFLKKIHEARLKMGG